MGTTPIYNLRFPDGDFPSTTWYLPWQHLAEDVEDQIERLDRIASDADETTDDNVVVPTGGTPVTLTTNVEIDVGPRGLAIVNFQAHIEDSTAGADTRVWRIWTILAGQNNVDDMDDQWRVRSGMFGGSSFYGSNRIANTRIFHGLNPGTTTFTMWANCTTDTFTIGDRRLTVVTL